LTTVRVARRVLVMDKTQGERVSRMEQPAWITEAATYDDALAARIDGEWDADNMATLISQASLLRVEEES
jgi:hypothetical protein